MTSAWQNIDSVPKDGTRVDLKDEWSEVTTKNKWDERGLWVRGKRDQILLNPFHQTHWRLSK